MFGEGDQTANDENKEVIEIVNQEVDNPIDENCSIILAELDEEEEEKEGTVKKIFIFYNLTSKKVNWLNNFLSYLMM